MDAPNILGTVFFLKAIQTYDHFGANLRNIYIYTHIYVNFFRAEDIISTPPKLTCHHVPHFRGHFKTKGIVLKP